MVPISAVYEGELHTAVTHGPSRTTLATDAPTDNQGRGASFSPTDLVATALGTCMMTIMGIVARDLAADGRDCSLIGTQVKIEKEMAASPRRIGRIGVRFEMPVGLDQEARKLLEDAARGCPVCQSLGADVEVDLTFVYE